MVKDSYNGNTMKGQAQGLGVHPSTLLDFKFE